MPTTPALQLDRFLAKYTPEVAAVGRKALTKMRAFLPSAVQMVYDNYNALVIGFGPTERPSEALFSIVLYPRYVGLCFLHGVGLPDPKKLLQGSGKQVRWIRLSDASVLDQPDVRVLMMHAIDRSAKPFGSAKHGHLVIKSISAKQRPRKPGKAATKQRSKR